MTLFKSACPIAVCMQLVVFPSPWHLDTKPSFPLKMTQEHLSGPTPSGRMGKHLLFPKWTQSHEVLWENAAVGSEAAGWGASALFLLFLISRGSIQRAQGLLLSPPWSGHSSLWLMGGLGCSPTPGADGCPHIPHLRPAGSK